MNRRPDKAGMKIKRKISKKTAFGYKNGDPEEREHRSTTLIHRAMEKARRRASDNSGSPGQLQPRQVGEGGWTRPAQTNSITPTVDASPRGTSASEALPGGGAGTRSHHGWIPVTEISGGRRKRQSEERYVGGRQNDPNFAGCVERSRS